MCYLVDNSMQVKCLFCFTYDTRGEDDQPIARLSLGLTYYKNIVLYFKTDFV